MKKCVIFVVSVIMGGNIMAQRDSYYRETLSVDVSYLSAAIFYSARIDTNLFLGIGGGAGWPFSRFNILLLPFNEYSKKYFVGEVFHIDLFGKHLFSKHFELDIGVKAEWALFDCGDWWGGVLGLYLKPMYGWRYIKVGTEINFATVGIYTVPILLRGAVPFSFKNRVE